MIFSHTLVKLGVHASKILHSCTVEHVIVEVGRSYLIGLGVGYTGSMFMDGWGEVWLIGRVASFICSGHFSLSWNGRKGIR